MQFVKMHGIGNDFVLVNCMETAIPDSELADLSRRVNDRKFGVGGDGLILVLPSRTADFTMRMFNPDGSEAEMCGNGIRCFAKFVHDNQLTHAQSLTIDTGAGVRVIEVVQGAIGVTGARVDMGTPGLLRGDIPMVGVAGDRAIETALTVGRSSFAVTAVSMGNPHAVIFAPDVRSVQLETFGPLLEHHPDFPERTNVHFVQVTSACELVMRTWERGAGITLACGTGACACVVAAAVTGRTGRSVMAHLPGGDLSVEWAADNHVYMTGPAETVFEGQFPD